jgi:hypothetical protein
MNFSSRAQQLNTLLNQHQSLWRHNAYNEVSPRSFRDFPNLLVFLLNLSDEELQHLQANDRDLLTALAPYFPPAAELLSLITLAAPPPHQNTEPPRGIPGRKWLQIQAFIDAHPRSDAASHSGESLPEVRLDNTAIIEWCSGKGYLSEALTKRYELDAIGLEIDPSLVAAGNLRASTAKHHRRVIACDVLSDQVFQHVDSSRQLLALHACGGLHQRLLNTAAVQKNPRLSISPCCYHRFNQGEYRYLSAQMQGSELRFSNDDLRTAVRQTKTARSGETQARRQLQAWYLGLRLILEEHRIATNTPLPSTPQHWSKTSFRDWLNAVLILKPLELSLPANLTQYEKAGWQCLREAERIDLVRMAFRRAIELHCVLDSVLFLEEHHYHCTLSEFCASSLTPRNLLIQAEKV